MIHSFDNCPENIKFFKSIVIVHRKHLSDFNEHTHEERLIEIINNIPESADALHIKLLPDNLTPRVSHKSGKMGKYSDVKMNFDVIGQSQHAEDLFDSFHNEPVIGIVYSEEETAIYGTKVTPLIFSYKEVNPRATQYHGYQISLAAKVYGKTKRLGRLNVAFVNNGLAFTLARTI